ncbi:MAG: hypothetical protein JSW33_08940 [bacterium]|nr:MAG: hypothetical protein JSW33_08940 [bacterium]
MAKTASLSLREDSLIWTEFIKTGNNIHLERAVFETLPVFINHQTIQQKLTATKLINFLKETVKKNNLTPKDLRLTIPGRFSLIKKIAIDPVIPEQNREEAVAFEFEKLWEESNQNYHIYLPENSTSEKMITVAIRKSVLKFFNQIFDEAQLPVSIITSSCFTIEELATQLYPNSNGHNLLLGWQRRGFDAIVTENQAFHSYVFKNYNNKLNPVESVSEFDLANSFSNLLFDLQHPKILNKPLLDIQTIYNYGYYFKPEWLDFMRNRVQVPINLFNIDASSLITITTSESDIPPEQIFRYIEPISNYSE